jgi:phosphoenolpyruvate synthase/pyruvate phosphate dikinase
MKNDLKLYEKLLNEGKLDLILKGEPGSRGISIGDAKVGSDVSSIKNNIKTGDIIVVESTKPPDVPYLMNCGAIVTDTGGKSTHAAIFSTHYNIPCVAGTGNGTKMLENYNGKLLVYVDYYTGLVYKVKGV